MKVTRTYTMSSRADAVAATRLHIAEEAKTLFLELLLSLKNERDLGATRHQHDLRSATG